MARRERRRRGKAKGALSFVLTRRWLQSKTDDRHCVGPESTARSAISVSISHRARRARSRHTPALTAHVHSDPASSARGLESASSHALACSRPLRTMPASSAAVAGSRAQENHCASGTSSLSTAHRVRRRSSQLRRRAASSLYSARSSGWIVSRAAKAARLTRGRQQSQCAVELHRCRAAA